MTDVADATTHDDWLSLSTKSPSHACRRLPSFRMWRSPDKLSTHSLSVRTSLRSTHRRVFLHNARRRQVGTTTTTTEAQLFTGHTATFQPFQHSILANILLNSSCRGNHLQLLLSSAAASTLLLDSWEESITWRTEWVFLAHHDNWLVRLRPPPERAEAWTPWSSNLFMPRLCCLIYSNACRSPFSVFTEA